MANLSTFEDYFRRADIDKDGKISGAEAVGFFQGANLPQHVLAKIWQFANQGQTGFLSKLEFYNALKLVTVAQSGRELTPEIVRAALAGPAAAQIPAPRIVTPGSQPSSYGNPPVGPQPGLSNAPLGTPQAGPGSFPDQAPSANGVTRWSSQPAALPSNPALPSQAGQPRPGSATGQRTTVEFAGDTWPSIRSSASASNLHSQAQGSTSPVHNLLGGPNTNTSSQGHGKKDPFASQGFLSGVDDLFSGVAAPPPKSAAPALKSASTGTVSSLADTFGNDPFTVNAKSLALTLQNPTPQQPAASGNANNFHGVGDFGDGAFRAEPARTMALVATGTGPPRDVAREPQTGVGTLTRAIAVAPSASTVAGFSASPSGGPGAGVPWPRMTPSDAQRYTRVFADVDTGRIGKISGQQAHGLFLSWGLPREVLKQVWDLSDQDGDSQLSLREFCTALYLMERFREGRPLPPVLPTGFHLEEPPQPQPEVWPSVAASRIEQARASISHHSAGHNVPSWQQNPGTLQPPGSASGAMPRGLPTVGDRSMPPQASNSPGVGGDTSQPAGFKSKAPILEPHLLNQLSRDEQDTLKSKHKDAQEADKKAYDLDKEIMDYKEKAEFYRTKLQEIILFKSRCDNRLSEITERVAADKREMESLAKRYDERFKATGEVNSRLQAEEAAFRDIQEKKVELYNAIAKMEQGGDSDGLLQSKADRIAFDLDELRKAHNERARRLGLKVKATAPSQQQFGWQPGMQDNSTEWDEDWDKFDDEGFISVQDFMDDSTASDFTAPSAKRASAFNDNEKNLFDDGFDFSSPSLDHKALPKEGLGPGALQSGPASPRAESEASGRSGLESPTRDVPPSTLEAVEEVDVHKLDTLNKASQRYANVDDSHDSGADVFNEPPSLSSTTNSFDKDGFGDGGVSWSASFNHDEEVDSGVRASWGLQSSTQASFDVGSSRPSRFGKAESSNFGDSFDFGSSHVSSPARTPNEPSSPAGSHRSNGDFRTSEEYDAFGPLGGPKDSSSFFGDNNTTMGISIFDKAASGNDRAFSRFDSFGSSQNDAAFSGKALTRFDSISSPPNNSSFTHASVSRFDSFSSPQNNQAFSGASLSRFDSFSNPLNNPPGEEHRDNSHTGVPKDTTFARFDSFSSVQIDGAHGGGGMFGAFDDGDDYFGRKSDPFGSKTQDEGEEKKWSAF